MDSTLPDLHPPLEGAEQRCCRYGRTPSGKRVDAEAYAELLKMGFDHATAAEALKQAIRRMLPPLWSCQLLPAFAQSVQRTRLLLAAACMTPLFGALQHENNASVALEALMDSDQRTALTLAAGLAAAQHEVEIAQVIAQHYHNFHGAAA